MGGKETERIGIFRDKVNGQEQLMTSVVSSLREFQGTVFRIKRQINKIGNMHNSLTSSFMGDLGG